MVKVVEITYKKLTCKKCDSVLEYTFSDIATHRHSYDYTGSFEVTTGIRCPVCYTIIKVDK